jgi:hypothetical protein
MNEQFSAEAEKSKQAAMEKARKLTPTLRELHDFLEDRSVMGNQEVADYIASQFTNAGVEVFSDFVKDLEAAKARQSKEERE